MRTIAGLKWCPKCKDLKDPSEFCKDKGKPDGLNAWCRKCRSAHRRTKHNPKRHLVNVSTTHATRGMLPWDMRAKLDKELEEGIEVVVLLANGSKVKWRDIE